MSESDEVSAARELMLAHLGWIERCTRNLCRRYGLSGDDASDVEGWIKLRLTEDDYAAFRKFRGDSSIRTYIVVVIAALFRDYRAGYWGRWRPSAASLRLGNLAVRLEALVYRDGLPVSQAIQVMRSSDPDLPPDRELVRLLDQLPVRGPLRPVSAPLGVIPAARGDHADVGIQDSEAQESRRLVQAALERVLASLPEEDRVILSLHYWKGLSIGDIARTLHLPQKPLYRRIERILKELRRGLDKEGIDRSALAETLSDEIVP